MIAEITIGRKTERDASGAFLSLGFPRWKFLGFMGISASFIGLALYSVIAAWSVGYFTEMAMGNFSVGQQFDVYVTDIFKVGFFGFLFIAITAFIVSKGISGGIEKASKILMPTLLVMIVLLGAYALTLPHAFDGVRAYLIPDFSKIDLPLIYKALAQAFFSLSIGMGAYITYGSYLSKNDNLIASASLITLADISVAFLAGFMMFPLVAYLSDGAMENVTGGPGLIFATLPSVFESLGPVMGSLAGSFFFLLLSFAALTTSVALLEVPVAYMIDEFEFRRKHATYITAFAVFLASIPSLIGNGYSPFFTRFIQYGSMDEKTNFLSFILHINDAIMLSGGLLIAIFVSYQWTRNNYSAEICQGFKQFEKSLLSRYVDFTLKYLCPLILALLLTLTVIDRYLGITIFG